MAWPKASPELTEQLERELFAFDVTKRMMFGGPAYFVNNNMMGGVHGDSVMLRLDEEDRGELAEIHGAHNFEAMGRQMREYMVLPDAVAGDPEELRDWLGRSFAFVASLPPKQPKAKKKGSTGKRKG